MARGLIAGVIVTLLWISIQILVVHRRLSANRFKMMLFGYVLSLPFIPLTVGTLPIGVSPNEPASMALGHAFLLHLLLFILYVQVFYHIERSVTLRLLMELLEKGTQGAEIAAIQRQYSVADMVERRMAAMEINGYVTKRGDRWYNKRRGAVLAQLMLLSSRLFRSKSQTERVED